MIARDRIQYRVSRTGNKNGQDWAQCLVYIDQRTASEELDSLYDSWSFEWEMIEGQAWAVKGTLIVGDRKHQDVGYPNDFKKTQDQDSTQWLKDAISDALKRCAVQAGVGRFLYDAPDLYTRGVNGKWLTDEGKKDIEKQIDDWYKELK